MEEPRLYYHPNGAEKRLTMNVAMMQPAFIPWQGLFELIYKADIFIFLDDFQFSVQSYHQRNRLFVDKERVDWYTVPVLKSVSFGLPLNQTRISEQAPWRQKMWKRIYHNYAKAPFYEMTAPHIQKLALDEDRFSCRTEYVIYQTCVRTYGNSAGNQAELTPSFKISELAKSP